MAAEPHRVGLVPRRVTGPNVVPDPSATRVIVLAGGRGRRLAPYTSVLPKPLMPIGDRSILEILVEQLADAGLTDLTFCVGYLSHLIRAVFDNGPGKRVNIRHVKEEEPLGTAGPLRLVEGLDSTFLVMNGDLLTDLSFNRLLQSHRTSGNVVTIATHERILKSDYGVLHLENADDDMPPRVTAYEEKPELSLNVSMGIYAMEPEALDYIDPRGHFDFPDLVKALLENGRQVGAFPHGITSRRSRSGTRARAATRRISAQPTRSAAAEAVTRSAKTSWKSALAPAGRRPSGSATSRSASR
jgi:NDP-mannose synthase